MSSWPASPSSTHAHRTTIRGVETAIWDRPGAARPIVFLHGNSSSKEAFRALFESPRLADHRLVAFDFPGCGESADADDWKAVYTLPALGEFVVDVVRERLGDRFVLLGWSLGGHIAIESLLHGLRPMGVVLSGTPPCGPDPADIAATFLPVPGGEVTALESPSLEQLDLFLTSIYAPSSPNETDRTIARRTDGRLRANMFAHIFGTPDLEPQRTTVANWPGPIALIQGRQEPFFHPAKLDKQRWGQLWRGQTQWVEDAGHAPFVTQPDAYAVLLKAFVDDIS